MKRPRYSSLLEVNTRVWLTELAHSLGRPATLDDIPASELDRLAALGFDWIWLLSVWQTGAASRQTSRGNPEWRREFEQTLPDLRDEDIGGSGFAITGYSVHRDLGSDEVLARLRARLANRGPSLLLDFVPNHTALDHPWVDERPEFYIPGTDDDLIREPRDYVRAARANGDWIFAHGRDPFFPGWPDTLQLDCSRRESTSCGRSHASATACAATWRCWFCRRYSNGHGGADRRVFGRGRWRRSVRSPRISCSSPRPTGTSIGRCSSRALIMPTTSGSMTACAAAARGRCGTSSRPASTTRTGSRASWRTTTSRAWRRPSPRGPRGGGRDHLSLAWTAVLSPGPVRRAPHANLSTSRSCAGRARQKALQAFHQRLLPLLRRPVIRNDHWCLLECNAAWGGNWTHDRILAFTWDGTGADRPLVAVSCAPSQSLCYLPLPYADLAVQSVRLLDQLGPAVYDRNGGKLLSPGLHLDLPPWGHHVFELASPT